MKILRNERRNRRSYVWVSQHGLDIHASRLQPTKYSYIRHLTTHFLLLFLLIKALGEDALGSTLLSGKKKTMLLKQSFPRRNRASQGLRPPHLGSSERPAAAQGRSSPPCPNAPGALTPKRGRISMKFRELRERKGRQLIGSGDELGMGKVPIPRSSEASTVASKGS